MDTEIGDHGVAAAAYQRVALAREYAQSPLPKTAIWAGNIDVRDIGNALNETLGTGIRAFIQAPKGGDTMTEDDLRRWTTALGGGQANLINLSDLPSSQELTDRGFVGVYHLPAPTQEI